MIWAGIRVISLLPETVLQLDFEKASSCLFVLMISFSQNALESINLHV